MRQRTYAISFRLSDKELAKLDNLVKRTGLTRSSYLRHLIDGLIPQDNPGPDYLSMMRELRRTGVNLNQIAARANATNRIDREAFDKVVVEYRKALMDITNAVLLPRVMFQPKGKEKAIEQKRK